MNIETSEDFRMDTDMNVENALYGIIARVKKTLLVSLLLNLPLKYLCG